MKTKIVMVAIMIPIIFISDMVCLYYKNYNSALIDSAILIAYLIWLKILIDMSNNKPKDIETYFNYEDTED
jgi:hypothetical protein